MKIIKEMYGLDLNSLIIQWAKERDLVKRENATKQYFKLIEEKGELFGAILKNDKVGIIDAIGDIQVVKIILCSQFDVIYKTDDEKTFENADAFNKALLTAELDNLMLMYNEVVSEFLIVENGIVKDLKRDYLIASLLVLEQIGQRLNLTLEECLTSAYQEIKDRKGKTINGSFVKAE